MEDLRWILLGLGALVLLGLYLFSRKRRGDAIVPFNDELKDDPLEAAPVARRAEPHIEDISHWGDEGVGPVRRRTLEEDAATPPRPAPRRTPRFSYEATPRPVSSAGQAPRAAAPAAEPPAAHPAPEPPVSEQPAEAAPPAVVPVYLVARDPQGFAGATLLDVFARHGFEFGEMDVYHHADARGTILFSLMNGVAPGTFDPSTLSEQRTPALALFLRLPIPAQPGLVFEQFLDIAHRLAEELDATLLDERREELCTESIDRMREITLGE
ncbi:cell division protein ZipA C-terminal FtsZ-binding domain-containing protein [Thiofaba sp. EF100]|uniref:cell division protein ZipA C-terminal FtsZ-binding domain-containing protein n=1 Tax=Thiofaba sp. EF100 TaxID=3121274 RepID=UPI0032215FDA